MERYENIVKIEEIRKLVENNQYEKAMKILDTMDTGKIKALTDLSVIADVYTQNERYEEAMEVLTRIYGKTKTRRVLYQLVDLSIKRGSVSEAEDYLEKYTKAAPQDSSRFIFRYCIDKLNHEPYEVLIASLEQLKEYEYYEMWAYELAKLYHKAGMKDKCVRECSDIILWFGDGIYVEKAKLLKGYYVGEINPVHMLKAKEKKEAEKKLGLDKTKDYSDMRSQIDQLIANDDTALKQNVDMHQIEFSDNEDDKETIEEHDQELQEFFKKVARKLEKQVVTKKDPVSDNIINFVKDPEKDPEKEYEESYTETKKYTEDSTDGDSSGKEEVITSEEDKVDEMQDNDDDITEEIQDYEADNESEVSVNYEYNKLENLEVNGNEEEAVKNENDKEVEEVKDDGMKEVRIKNDEIIVRQIEPIPLPDGKNTVSGEYEFKVMKQPAFNTEEIKKETHYIPGKFDAIFSEAGMNYEKDFGYFICNDFCRNQIESCLENILADYTKTNHMMIIGERKSGKTTLAKKISKALYGLNWINTNRVAKIAASKLNGISLASKTDKLAGSSLIIEEAGLLDANAVEQLLSLIQYLNENIFVILEDNENGMKKLFNKNPMLEEVFSSAICLPEYTKEDLYGFAFTYIRNNDYEFTREVKTAFEKKIENIIQSVKTEDQLEAVMKLAKKAKTSADERNKSLLSDIILDRDLNSEDYLYIKMNDF